MHDMNDPLDPAIVEMAARAGFAAAATTAAKKYGLNEPVTWDEHLTDDDREHELIRTRAVLDAVADDLRAEGAAKVLREAADFGEQEGDPVDDVCDWLRARADAIEAGQP